MAIVVFFRRCDAPAKVDPKLHRIKASVHLQSSNRKVQRRLNAHVRQIVIVRRALAAHFSVPRISSSLCPAWPPPAHLDALLCKRQKLRCSRQGTPVGGFGGPTIALDRPPPGDRRNAVLSAAWSQLPDKFQPNENHTVNNSPAQIPAGESE